MILEITSVNWNNGLSQLETVSHQGELLRKSGKCTNKDNSDFRKLKFIPAENYEVLLMDGNRAETSLFQNGNPLLSRQVFCRCPQRA
jgi:hypothetical protein